MVVAVVLATIVMMVFAAVISSFVERHPTFKMLALGLSAPSWSDAHCGGTSSTCSQGLYLFCHGFCRIYRAAQYADASQTSNRTPKRTAAHEGKRKAVRVEAVAPRHFHRIRCALSQLICSEESGRYFIAHLDQWLSVSFDTSPVQSRSDILQRYAEDGVADFLQGQFSVIVALGNNHLYYCMESIGGFFVLEASNFRCGGSHKGI